MSSSVHVGAGIGVISMGISLDEPELLSVGEIDARYMKILRMRGDSGMAEDYDMRRRFKREHTVSTSQEVLKACGSGSGGAKRLRQGTKMGVISREILHPEDPVRDQPTKMKKEKNRSADEVKGMDKSDVWATDTANRGVFVENAFKDFLFYIIFLIITNMITFGILDHAYNYYATTLSDIITKTEFKTDLGVSKTFNEVRNIQQIWDFITIVLLGLLYEHGGDHGMAIRVDKKDDVLVLFENILVGVPRIRQQRVRNDSCKTSSVFEDLFSSCYNYYSDAEQGTEPFGMEKPTAWVYSEPDADSARYFGKISNYGGGGYMMTLTNNKEYTKNWITELLKNRWIRQGTRAVFIDFTTYTPNTNLFCVVKLVFELPPTGGVIPSAHFYTMKFLRYVNTWDHFVLGCEIVFLCYIVYFTMEELQLMISMKEEYWYSAWNILDINVLLLAYYVVISACVRYAVVTTGMKEKVDRMRSEYHASFDNFVRVEINFNNSADLLTFFVWLKLLKFAALNKSVALILSLFGRVKFELIALTLMIITMVVGFALLGNMLFGTHVEQFNTVWHSIFSLVGIFIGGLYFYMDCSNARPIMAPIYFIFYIFLISIFFLNSYVALIVHGFHKAVEEFDDSKDRLYLGDICRSFMYKLLKLIGKGKLANKMRDRAHFKACKKDYDDFLNIVKKHGYRGLDVTMLMKKHNLTPGSPVPFEKMSQLYNEIDAKNQLFLEVDEHDKLMDQVDVISKKVDSLDKSMSEVAVKVDKLVNQLLYSAG